MNLSRFVLNRLAALLRVPTAAVDMLRAANTISGIEKKSMPTELVSLNALQFSRGLLNFSFFQSNFNWVFPYWAVRQYDPADPAFIPRAHLGLSMNLTHRNWTAVGSPECPTEPIVDPRGLVTPFRDGWSIDVWIDIDGITYFPSRMEAVQSLHEHYPVVITEVRIGLTLLRLTTFVDRTTLVHSAHLSNTDVAAVNGTLIVALRPFNPEGVGLISSLSYSRDERRVDINNCQSIFFSLPPSSISCSHYRDGDAAWMPHGAASDRQASDCPAGLATGVYRFPFSLGIGDETGIDTRVPLDETAMRPKHMDAIPVPEQLRTVTRFWDDTLHHGASISTPDAAFTAAVKSNLVTLHMLCDGRTITPGPSSYHHFWFRDAAYMLHALDAFGHHEQTRPVIENFFTHLEPDGYFRSQKGEWDSNGQALWVMHEHVLLSGSDECVRRHQPELLKAVRWIDKKRITAPEQQSEPWYGLMPSGLSAEHLGLADYYYWDNFWSLAGVRSFIALCSFASAHEDAQYAQSVYDTYAATVDRSLERDHARLSTDAIPAAPGRAIDCGTIGSLSALYPLQLFDLGAARLEATVAVLAERFCIDDLFFQHFIHSGKNIYLSLQLAHSYLLLGDRKHFWRILSSVRRHATSTGTYPEAIHPVTGGGSMGDGHHGWAAAEFVLAARAMFVLDTEHELRLLAGTPEEWYRDGNTFSLGTAPTHAGTIGITVHNDAVGVQIVIDLTPHEFARRMKWLVLLPFNAAAVTVDGRAVPFRVTACGETEIDLAPGTCAIVVRRTAPQDPAVRPAPQQHLHNHLTIS